VDRPRSRSRAAVGTLAPSVLAVAVLGLALDLRWIPGPHSPALTVVPAAAACIPAGAVASVPRLGRRGSPRTQPRRGAAVFEGVRQASAEIGRPDWKLLGAITLYAFDNAVLWAAFRAFGRSRRLASWEWPT
jgi:hypothetical protein